MYESPGPVVGESTPGNRLAVLYEYSSSTLGPLIVSTEAGRPP